MVRSVPEKTLEHWASMYVAHRFPRSSIWWPTLGEDIRIEDFGTVAGKAFYLEVKVPEQYLAQHVTTIDVPQLVAYTSQPVPVYYVFPVPPWTGELLSSGWLGLERRADLAYRRTGTRWFGAWTHVVDAHDLLAHLAPATGQRTAQVAGMPPHWPWPDFWRAMADCGSPDVQAMFVLPADLGSPSRAEMRSFLRDFALTSNRNRSSENPAIGQRYDELDRHYYVPLQSGSDAYRQIGSSDLSDVRVSPDVQTALAVCTLPFDALRLV